MAGFELFVDDNYHYMDEQSRHRVGSFLSYEEALSRAKAIVDKFLGCDFSSYLIHPFFKSIHPGTHSILSF
jgi:hypothetical protein